MANCYVIVDPRKCIGCRTCEIACVVAHSKNNIFLKSDSEIKFFPKLEVLKTATVTVPVQCKQCVGAPCKKVCPVNAIELLEDRVKINTEICIGCKSCVSACPFGAMGMAEEEGTNRIVANKCDLCSEREGGPACIQVCPNDALRIVNLHH